MHLSMAWPRLLFHYPIESTPYPNHLKNYYGFPKSGQRPLRSYFPHQRYALDVEPLYPKRFLTIFEYLNLNRRLILHTSTHWNLALVVSQSSWPHHQQPEYPAAWLLLELTHSRSDNIDL